MTRTKTARASASKEVAVIAGGKRRSDAPFKLDPARAPWTPEEFFQSSFGAPYRNRLKHDPWCLIVWGEEPVWHTPQGTVRLRPRLTAQIVALRKRFDALTPSARSDRKLRQEVKKLVTSFYAKTGHDTAELPTAVALGQALVTRLEPDTDGMPSHEMLLAKDIATHMQAVGTQLLQSPSPDRYTGEPKQLQVKMPKSVSKNAGDEITRRKPRSKLPGYVPDSRADTVALTAHVPLELREAVHRAAKMSKGSNGEKISTQDYLVAVLTYAAANQQPDQAPVKVDVDKALGEHSDAKRAAIRHTVRKLASSLR